VLQKHQSQQEFVSPHDEWQPGRQISKPLGAVARVNSINQAYQQPPPQQYYEQYRQSSDMRSYGQARKYTV
jgi:hypothetical protein